MSREKKRAWGFVGGAIVAGTVLKARRPGMTMMLWHNNKNVFAAAAKTWVLAPAFMIYIFETVSH
jgi:hypothetical protein